MTYREIAEIAGDGEIHVKNIAASGIMKEKDKNNRVYYTYYMSGFRKCRVKKAVAELLAANNLTEVHTEY